jgi:hypothetical protein
MPTLVGEAIPWWRVCEGTKGAMAAAGCKSGGADSDTVLLKPHFEAIVSWLGCESS